MYQRLIKEEMARQGFVGQYDPRHIEAYMRLEHGTLDSLNPRQFAQEVTIGMECIKADGTQNAEACARSFGL